MEPVFCWDWPERQMYRNWGRSAVEEGIGGRRIGTHSG